MESPTLLLINGASGSGKTTLAGALALQIESSDWIHPDGLWKDTPTTSPETILIRATELAFERRAACICIIDCQIRPSRIDTTLQALGSPRWINVLLTCSREVRDRRLLQRTWHEWSASELDTIDNWAGVLLEEARKARDLIADSSVESVSEICIRVQQFLQAKGLEIGG